MTAFELAEHLAEALASGDWGYLVEDMDPGVFMGDDPEDESDEGSIHTFTVDMGSRGHFEVTVTRTEPVRHGGLML